MKEERAMSLGKRLVACEGFRWMAGMRPRHLDGVGYLHGANIPNEDHAKALQGNRWWWPDMRDPATRGCVLELVRDVGSDYRGAGTGRLWIEWTDSPTRGWIVRSELGGGAVPDEWPLACSEADAMVMAMETASPTAPRST